jgi:hypothetical protein
MKSRLNQIKVSMTAPRMIGKHKDCGGNVFYHAGLSFAYRQCSECGQNGLYGQFSPTLETER